MNDAHVSRLAEEKVATENAYILVYVRQDLPATLVRDRLPVPPDRQPPDIEAVRKADWDRARFPPPAKSSFLARWSRSWGSHSSAGSDGRLRFPSIGSSLF